MRVRLPAHLVARGADGTLMVVLDDVRNFPYYPAS